MKTLPAPGTLEAYTQDVLNLMRANPGALILAAILIAAWFAHITTKGFSK